MKIIFAGTSQFGLPTLEKIKKNHQLLFAITNPDKQAGREHKLTPSPVKQWSIDHQIPVLQPEKIYEIEADIKKSNPDLLLVAAYGQIIPKNILEIPKFGSVNIHASLLPKYRGASPIQTAILNGEKKTGITLILMDEKMDHGPIVASRAVNIDPNETSEALSNKLADTAADLVLETLSRIAGGKIKAVEQNHKLATFTKLIKSEDARINWGRSAEEISNHIRAFNPNPGAWTTLEGKTVKIFEAEQIQKSPIELSGKIFKFNNDLAVKTLDKALVIKEVQPAGGKKMKGSDFLNGIKNIADKFFV